MNNKAIVFQAPMKVICQEMDDVSHALGIDEILVKKIYSLISTGTELACLRGIESWFNMPAVPGYCCVSEVVKVGENVSYAEGDILFHYGEHSRYQVINQNEFIFQIKDTSNLKLVPMLRMATIAFTAIRVSDVELGDWVSVTGLGLVGNMAAQLATLSGGYVIGIDPSDMRREKAKLCGIPYLFNEGIKNDIMEITDGQGVHTAIEATGIPQVAYDILDSIGYHGEIILLGTPRGDTTVNLADVLSYSHIDGKGSITFKGAHEWRYPLNKNQFIKHSIERNTEICMKLIQDRKLCVEELISHVITPEKAPEVYLDINMNRDEYLGIIIDWS
jgi:2-desacetyl-2-hydroxyethyl bacteriochlorophyllide A dehydrogenase